jgi:integrase
MKRVQPIREKYQIDDIKQILKSKNERNFIMFAIGIYTGLRISDILQLKVKDLKNQEYLTLNEKKTRKASRILINPLLKRDLRKYLENRNDDEYIIKSREGSNKPLKRSMAYKILRDAANELGLQDIGTHTLRKTFGYHYYQKTKDIGMLMELFNHSKESITLRYIGVNQDMRDKAMKNFRY